MHWWWIQRIYTFFVPLGSVSLDFFLYLDFKLCEGCRFFLLFNSSAWIFCRSCCECADEFFLLLLPSQCAFRVRCHDTHFFFIVVVKFYPFALLLNLLNPFKIHIKKNFEDFFLFIPFEILLALMLTGCTRNGFLEFFSDLF